MSKSVPASYFQDETQNLREANRRGVAFAEARQQSEKQHRLRGVCGGSMEKAGTEQTIQNENVNDYQRQGGACDVGAEVRKKI